MRPGASGNLEDPYSNPTDVGSLAVAPQYQAELEKPKSFLSLIRYNKWALIVTAGALIVMLGAGAGALFLAGSQGQSTDLQSTSPASQFGTQQLGLANLSADETLQLAKASTLDINGSLRLNGGLLVAPSAAPAKPTAGQIYFDQDSNKLFVYNGTAFDGLSADASVESLGGSTGALTTSADFQVVNNQLALSPKFKQLIDAKTATVQGQTAQVQLTAGTGIVVSGTTINNTGVLSIIGANGLQAVQTNGNVTLSLPQALGTADSPTFAAVQLSSALGVAYGGTGLSFGGMTANSVMITSADGSSYELVPATAGGQCLITDALDSNKIKFGNCSGSSGGGGVTSLNTIDGDATLASSDGTLTVINNVAGKTIDLKLPQALGTTASPTFTGVTATTFSGNGSALTAVNAAQLNGQAASFYTNAGNLGSGTLADARLSSNVAQLSAANNFTGTLQHSGNNVCDASNNCNYLTGASAAGSFIQLQGATPGTAQVGNFNITGTGRATTFYQNGNAVCDMTGNCAGAGGGLTGAGTAGTIAVYTATGVLGNSLLTQSGSTVSLSGTLAATALTGNGAGVTNVDATLLNGQAASYYTNATNLSSGTVADARLSANVALLNAASNTFTGALTAASLTGNGAGLTNVDANKFNGQVASYYTDASNISSGTLADGRLSANVALLNAASNTFTGSVTATSFTGNGAGLTNVDAAKLNGQAASYYTNATNISAGTLADARLSANVALLNALSNTFTGTLTASTLNGDGTGITNVDAAKLGGQAGSYYLDATNLSAGTLADARLSANVALLNATNNFTGVLQHNGNDVCDASNNCNYLTGASASSNYIQLQATTPGTAQTGNFNIAGTGRATALYQNGNAVCDVTGNCAGAGGGVTGSGTSGTLAMFTGSGTIGDSLLSQAAGTVTVGGTLAATALTGDGAGVTNVDAATLNGQAGSYYTDASNIAAGTLDDARLTANVALLNALSNTFTGTVVANAFSGNGASVTNVDAAKLNGQVATFYTNASNLSAGTLADARLSANVALLNALSNTFTGTLTASSFTGNGAGVTNVDAAKLNGQSASYYTDATNITAGTLADARLSANVALLNALSNTFTGTLTASSFTGNGAGVTNVDAAKLGGQSASYYTNATNISAGTLADARLSANVALLNAASNTFTGTLTATSFTGNGAGLTNVDAATLNGQAGSYYTNASNLSTGTLADARLSANVALLNAASNTFTGTLTANALNGNGAGVTNVNAVQLNGQAASFYTNASNIGSGTLADARLSANVALLNAVSNTFTGSLTASTLTGNGAGVTNVDAAKLNGQSASYYTNATNLSSGTLADARLSANVALLNAATNTFTGNLAQTGSTTFSTGTGAVSLNGATAVAGNLTSNGNQFTNNSSTLNSAVALGDFASDGPVGTAAATVDVKTTLAIAQTTAGRTLSLPAPTSTTVGRMVYVLNTGSANLTMHGITIPAGYGQIYVWNGSAWILGASGGGSAITLQAAYDGGNALTTTNARDLQVTLADTATDGNYIVNVATGSTGQLKVQNNGTDVLAIGSAGQLALGVQGSAGGLLIGGDATLYRSAANTLMTTSSFVAKNAADSTTAFHVQNAAGTDVFNVDTTNKSINVGAPISYSLSVYSGGTGFGARVDYATGTTPAVVAKADFNGDGKPDMAVSNYGSNTVSVFINTGTGTFAAKVDYATGTNPYSVTATDFNADGKADLAVTNQNSNTVSVFINSGTGTFAAKVDYATGSRPIFVTAADFNGDGKADLAVPNLNSNTVSVFINSGTGTFAAKVDYATGSGANDVTAADFNGDGKADLAVTNNSADTVSVFINSGTGTFAAKVDYATGSGPQFVAAADFNGDGKADLAVPNFNSNTVSVFINSGTGTFAAKVDYTTGSSPVGVVSADFNGDGKADLAVTNKGSTSVSVFINSGTGTFAAKVDYATGGNPVGVTAADFDSDTKLDLAVTSQTSNTVSILINTATLVVTPMLSTASITASGINNTALTLQGVAGQVNDVLRIQDSTATALFTVASNGNVGVGNVTSLAGRTEKLTVAGAVNLTSTLLVGGVATFTGGITSNASSLVKTLSADTTTAFHVQNAAGTDVFNVDTTNKSISVGAPITYNLYSYNAAAGFSAAASYAANPTSAQMKTADLNADGKIDIVVPGSGASSVSIFLGNGDGTVQAKVDYAVASNAYSVVIADFNVDGKLDLAVTTLSGSISVLLGNGDGTFQAKTDYVGGVSFQQSIVAVDFNSDGKLDLASSGSGAATISVLLGNGDGTFQPKTDITISGNGYEVISADFNSDGKKDLAATVNPAGTASDGVSILLGNGDGTFAAAVLYPTADTPKSVVAGDFNNDSILDIASSASSGGKVSVFFGNGDGTFQAKTDYAVSSASDLFTIDLNGDGVLDLGVVKTGGGWKDIATLLNLGAGAFSVQPSIYSVATPNSAIASDLNGDGKPDIISTNTNLSTLIIFLNSASLTTTVVPATVSVTASNSNSSAITLQATGSQATDIMRIQDSAAAALFTVAMNGNIGIGNVANLAGLTYKLSVAGTANATAFYQQGNPVCDMTNNCGTIKSGVVPQTASFNITGTATVGGVTTLNGTTILNGVSTAKANFMIQNAGSVNLFAADTAANTITLGTATSGADTFTKLANPTTLPTGLAYGTAFSPDGQYMSVGHATSPYITIYKRSGDTFTKLADPATLPTGTSPKTAFSPDGQYMSVAHITSPYITIYKRSGDTFTKLADPATLPAGAGNDVAFSPDGQYMSVAHTVSPFITIYKRSGDTFTKLTNPASLPPAQSNSTAFSPDGQYMSVGSISSPYITIYKRSGDTFTKLTNPATLPAGSGLGTAFSPDGQYMSVAHNGVPYITIYKRSGDTFTKLANPATLPSNNSNSTAFSPDGQYMSVGSLSSPYIAIYKRSGDTFTKLANPATLPTANGTGTTFSPDGQYMSVAHTASPYITIYKIGDGLGVDLTVNGGTIRAGSTNVTSLTVNGGTTLQGTLAVASSASIGQDLGIGGALTIGGTTLTSASAGADTIKTSTGTNDFPTGWGAPANWTLSANSAVHASGSTTALTSTWTPTVGVTYQVSYTYSGCSASNTLGITLGGQTLETTTSCIGTNTKVITATSFAGLSFTPNSTYTGTISNVTVTPISMASSALSVQNSSGVATLEVRTTGSNTNLFLGVSSGQTTTTGTGNTATGNFALQSNTTGTGNTANGYQAMQSNTTGQANTAIGYGSLQLNTTGNYNTAIGYQALLSNTTGLSNVAIGYQALLSNVNGQNNVALGYNAMQLNTSGSHNIAFGTQSLNANTTGSYNIAAGYYSLLSNTTGSYNVASGFNGLQNNTTGTGNTASGYSTLLANTTGSRNSALGYFAGTQDSASHFITVATIQNATALGSYAQVQASNTIVLGSVDTATQTVIGATVGVGTNSFGVSPLDYQTGTATRTNSSATLVGTGTTWTAAMVGDRIIFADGTTNTVSAFTDATHITMGTTYAGTTDASPVYYRFHKTGFQVTNAGNAYIQSTSTTAFQVQNAAGTNVFSVDTTNKSISVGAPLTYTLNTYSAGAGFSTKVDYPTGSGPRGVTTGDFNGDGAKDMAITNVSSNTVSILLGTGSGTFGTKTDFTTGSSPYAVVTTDFNGDGKADLAIANGGTNTVSILLGTGSGTFGTKTDYAVGSATQSLTSGDFNGDGFKDIAAANYSSNTVSILLGTGTGTFGAKTDFATGTTPESVATADFNGDGKLDLATVNSGTSNASILLGTGTGTFGTKTDYTTGSSPRSIAIADFNGDGFKDLATANFGADTTSILLGTGTGTFGTKTDYATSGGPYTITLVDFNADGFQDIATGNINSSNLSILLGTGTGTFGTKTDYTTGAGPRSIANGDFNGDSKPDLVTANFLVDTASVLINASTLTVTPVLATHSVTASTATSTALMVQAAAGQAVDVVRIQDSAANQLFTIAKNGNVGIGVVNSLDTQVYKLNVTGSINATALYQAGNQLCDNTNNCNNIKNGTSAQTASFNVTGTGTIGGVLTANSSVLFKNAADSTTAFNVQNAAGTNVFTVDTTNKTISVGAPLSYNLYSYSAGAGFAAKADYATATGPRGMTIGDFNGDGASDLAIVNTSSSTVSILLGTGSGTFGTKTDFATGSVPIAAATADFNGDGKLDLVISNGGVSSVSVLLGTGTGTFGTKTDYTTASASYAVTTGDFNADGFKDIAAANLSSNSISILLGTGTGTFGTKTDFATNTSPQSIVAADFNGDGQLDLATANNNAANVSVLLGTGTGTFGTKTDYATNGNPAYVTTADFNGDGFKDLATANAATNSVSVLFGTGTGTFGTKTDYATGVIPGSVATTDFNADGFKDIVTANYTAGTVSVLLGTGSGTFGTKTDYTTGTNPNVVTTADFNGDGKQDIAVTNGGSNTVSVFINGSTLTTTSVLATHSVTASTANNGALMVQAAAGQAVDVVRIQDSAANQLFTIAKNGNVGIGVVNNLDAQIYKLTVAGGANVTGNLLVGGVATITGGATLNADTLVKTTTNSATAFQIQASDATALLVADTTTKKITVRDLTVSLNLTVNGHLITGGSNPTIAAGSAACTTPTITVTGTDTAGKITVTTGTGCAANGKLATITFATAFGAAPRVTLTAAGVNAAGLSTYIDDSTISTTAFDLGSTTTPTDATTYKWYYHVIQ